MDQNKIGGRPQDTIIEKFAAKYGHEFQQLIDSTDVDERKLSNILTLIKMKEYLLANKYYGFQLKLAYPEYYNQKLYERSQFLGSLTTDHLCKSIILENKKFNPQYYS